MCVLHIIQQCDIKSKCKDQDQDQTRSLSDYKTIWQAYLDGVYTVYCMTIRDNIMKQLSWFCKKLTANEVSKYSSGVDFIRYL